MKKTVFFFVLFFFVVSQQTISANNSYAYLQNDTLTIGNKFIERKFSWNGGNLITISLKNKKNNHTWISKSKAPDFQFTRNNEKPAESFFITRTIKKNNLHPDFFEAEIGYTLGSINIRRVYRLYDNSPTITCDTYLRGTLTEALTAEIGNNADLKNIEFSQDAIDTHFIPTLDRVHFDGKHWRLKAVEFFDVTDRNNNLVAEHESLAFRKNHHRGNLLFAKDEESDNGFFFLKEAPCSGVQLSYPGADFLSELGHISVVGLGVESKDINEGEWTKTYSSVLGIFSGEEFNSLIALREYQRNIRLHLPDRDEMIMMNTWGDRSQDAQIDEAFCLKEIDYAARLGVTHFQIDDGWQFGKSPNSAVAKGTFKNIWDNPRYWEPDPEKFPKGLRNVVEKGKKVGVEVCLWFNPSIQNEFENWEKDARVMIGFYKKYGIRIFKIDGLSIPTKLAETRLRKMFDLVLTETDNNVVFNLDATAGRRGGYHYFNEYGNIFLENRYTDWQNYYPYWTLRNLWMLSRYVPAEKLQIEFLNKWRNQENYGSDIFAPKNHSFEYLFATTMAAQPLAWFEGRNLPSEAFGIKKLIELYKNVQHDFHQGMILPIGEEPSGKSWTGFQSINGKEGYIIVYRENNETSNADVSTWLPHKAQVSLTVVLGDGTSFDTMVGKNGMISFELPTKNSFTMYKYRIN